MRSLICALLLLSLSVPTAASNSNLSIDAFSCAPITNSNTEILLHGPEREIHPLSVAKLSSKQYRLKFHVEPGTYQQATLLTKKGCRINFDLTVEDRHDRHISVYMFLGVMDYHAHGSISGDMTIPGALVSAVCTDPKYLNKEYLADVDGGEYYINYLPPCLYELTVKLSSPGSTVIINKIALTPNASAAKFSITPEALVGAGLYSLPTRL